jgi:TMEM175 potassium channel family protein
VPTMSRSNHRHRAGPRSDTTRAVGFSDAVIAVVITLLVFDLQPPEHEEGQLLSALLRQWPTYFAYLTSFLYVGVVWLNHKAAFNRIREMDRGLHWANLAILLTTSLLPFPTAVIADAVQVGHPADVRAAVGLYGLVGMLLCLSWWWLFHYLGRHPHLTREDVHHGFFPRERTRALVGIVLYAGATVIGDLVAPPIALVGFFAVAVFYGVTSHGFADLPVLRRGPASR